MESIGTSIESTIVDAERQLLDPAVRSDRAALERLFDPGFMEIGSSGKLWTRAEIIESLLDDDADYGGAILSEIQVGELVDGCYLLTYLVNVGARRSRRSSIWRIRNGAPVMAFHQGTPL